MNGRSKTDRPFPPYREKQMTTKDILELDFRNPKSYGIMQKVLKKIGPLAKVHDDEVKLEKLEKLLFLFQKKYFVEILWIFMSHEDDQPLYTISIKDSFHDTILGCVHGITLYEVVSKAVVAIWSHIKAERVRNRKDYK